MTELEPDNGQWHAAAALSTLTLLAIIPILFKEGVKAFATVVTYLSCLTLVKIFVKETMSFGLNCPDFITMTHMFWSATAAFILERPSTTEALAVLPISIVSGMALLLNNTAFLFGGVAFISMVSCSTPILNFILATVRSRRQVDHWSLGSVVLVVMGGTLCVNGEKVATVLAFILATGAAFFRACRSVLQEDLLSVRVSPLRLVFWSSFWCFLCMIPIMATCEGGKGFSQFASMPPKGKASFLLSILAACTLNISQCFAIKQLGSLMQNIVGNLNLILVIVLSQAWLHESVSASQFSGAFLLVIGTFMNKMVDKKNVAAKEEKLPTVMAHSKTESAPEGGDYNSMGHREVAPSRTQTIRIV